MGRQPSETRRRLLLVLPGMLITALVLLAGGAYVLSRPATYSASASFGVFPRPAPTGTEAGYYETLSRGQIVSTIAQLVKVNQAPPIHGASYPAVTVVSETSIVQLDVKAPTAAGAEEAADAGLQRAVDVVGALQLPYAAIVTNRAAGHAVRAGSGSAKQLAIVGLVAFTLGLAVQQATRAVTDGSHARAGVARVPAAGARRVPPTA